MKYCDLCKAFYIKTTSGGLTHNKGKGKISAFFINTAVTDKNGIQADVELPTSSSSYEKWFTGETSPKQPVWDAVKKMDERLFTDKLFDEINKDNASVVARNLGIRLNAGERVDVKRLALCVTRLLFSLAVDSGDTDKDIQVFYDGTEIKNRFSDYIRYAQERYNLMKLIGGDEVFLEDYFVCNTIGKKIKVGVDRSKIKDGYIDDATIEKIRCFYQKRGIDNRKVLLLGSGGSGKTLMLQHLLLESMSRFSETEILPVFLELRDYVQSDSIIGFLTNTLNQGGGSFSEEDVDELLSAGKLHILFDGLDEVDPSDIGSFQRQIAGFSSKYSATMIIIASRECEAKNGLRGFVPMYVWPFDNTQSMQLIDRILESTNESDVKEDIIRYIERGFIKKNGVFASHPMMLTFVARNYPKFDKYNKNHLLFYSGAYNALLSGHDDNKKPYDRIFRSVDNPEEFTEVFSEFCAKSYEKGEHEFDEEEFSTLFQSLKSYKNFKNTYKMNLKNFKQDACSTACMMYEEDEKTYYIDPGFQKYLFAHYYIHADSDETKKMGVALLNTSRASFDDYEAFDMLYGQTQEKIEYCVLYPFLQAIFRGKNEEESFAKYLEYGYDDIVYTVLYNDRVAEFVREKKSFRDLGFVNINEPRTVILDYIFNILKRDHTSTFITSDEDAAVEDCAASPVYGRFEDNRFGLTDAVINDNYDLKFEYVHDDQGTPIEMGTTYSVNTRDMSERIESFNGLIKSMISGDNDLYEDYLAVREFYDVLRKRKKEERVY